MTGCIDAYPSRQTLQRVLIVDDDPAVLTNLRRTFQRDRQRWDITFALGAEAALWELQRAPFDVVVTDLRMPEIDGATLLGIVQANAPQTRRIALGSELVHGDLADEVLDKPCEAVEVRAAVERWIAPRVY